MISGSMITAGLFVLLGAITAMNPLFAFNLRVWFARQALGMQITPGTRTLAAYRILGIVFALIGMGMFIIQSTHT